MLAWAAAHGVEVVPWGAGSSVTGAAVPRDGALSLDLRKLNRVLEVDRRNFRVRAEAGVLGGELEAELERDGLTTWFSPQSLHRSTVGGWLATRASGQYSSRWGGIEAAVLGLTAVLADGEVVSLGTPPRGAVGPDLSALFLGSEGALGVITEITLRLFEAEALRELDAYVVPDVGSGVEVLRSIATAGVRPAVLRLYDPAESHYVAGIEEAVILCAFAGAPAVASAEHGVVEELVGKAGGRSLGSAPVAAWLAHRFDFSRVEALLAEPGGYAETIEIADGWRGISSTYRALTGALAPLVDEVLCHFSHVYSDGTSLYVIVTGMAADDAEAVRRLEAVWQVAMSTALVCGAVISHHHGVGRARAAYLPAQLGGGYELLRKLKSALDPNATLHPTALGLGSPRAG